MNQFGDLYSQYYELLYHDKDYAGEADYVDKLIRQNLDRPKTLLNLGCGTGRHDVLLHDKGYQIHGVDISEEMLNIARNKEKPGLCFSQANIQQLNLGQTFDAVISLFHVMSYQTTNLALDQVFSGVNEHLNDDGLFIFDFWYGPAVLTDPPKNTIKRLENDRVKVFRVAEPNMHADSNTVDVNFDIFITQRNNNHLTAQQELHVMRFFFDTELEDICSRHHFKVEAKYRWLHETAPGFDTWNAVWVLRKI